MRAAVLQAGGRFAVEELPDPVPTGRQAVLRVIYCGICGSDLHALRAGTLPLGAVLGHEIGHVLRRHTVKQMEKQQGANVGITLACVLTGVCNSGVANAAIRR